MKVLKQAKYFTESALTALVLCLLFASDASAQVVADLPASTGTVMAAAMETAGYKAQEMILSQLHGMLGNLASLIYIICALVGIFSVVFTGGYRLGLWLLVAPHLFYWTIDNRTLASGVDWQFGSYQNQNGAVEEVLGYSNPQQGESNVSWLFHQYNRLVSSIIQETIKVVTDDQTKRQMKFMTRQHIMDDLFASQPTDPGLWGLVKWTTGICSQELQDARMLALGERDSSYKFTPEWEAAEERLHDPNSELRLETKNKPLYTTTGPLKYVKTVLDSLATKGDGALDSYTRARGIECVKDKTGYRYQTLRNSEKLEREAVSCSQLWCWMGVGLREEASGFLARSMDKHLQDDTSNDTYSEILQEIATKLHVCQPSSNPDEDPDGCARDEEGKPFQTVQPDESVIPTIMAGYLLRKIMTSDRHSDMMTTLGQHSGVSGRAFNFNSKMSTEQRQQAGQRMRQHQMAMAERAKVYSLAMTIPYIQGVLLYGLSMMFPFFALLLIIPSRAGAFFKWMALWFWVKSWDLGWAFVMIVDDVLWDLMPNHSKYNALADPNHGPITIFEQAFNGDPAYNLGFYYVIIGMLITGVPMISAQLIIGGKSAMFGMLVDGLKGMADQFGAAMHDWTAMGQANMMDRAREANIAFYTSTKVAAEQMAHKKAEEAKKKAEARKKRGGWLKWVGVGLAVAALAVATVATGGLALAAAGAITMTAAGVATATTVAAVGVGAAYAGYQASQKGLEMQRLASTQLAGITGANAELHFFNAGQLESSMMYDEMRAMISERGEYWNMNPDASEALAYLEKQEARAQQEETRLWVAAATEGITDIASAYAASKGRFVK